MKSTKFFVRFMAKYRFGLASSQNNSRHFFTASSGYKPIRMTHRYLHYYVLPNGFLVAGGWRHMKGHWSCSLCSAYKNIRLFVFIARKPRIMGFVSEQLTTIKMYLLSQ